MLFADADFSRRLEHAEGRAGAAFAKARGGAAVTTEIAGAIVSYDSPESPVTQTFGLGLSGPLTASSLDEIEEFFESRGAHVHHEVSPHADSSVWPLLMARRYTPFEFTNVLYRELDSSPAWTGDIQVTAPADPATWAATASEGWREFAVHMPDLPALMHATSRCESAVLFLGSLNGSAIAAGALNIQNDIALLAGASTIPSARCKGAQTALLAERLHYAADRGCGIAMIATAPGSGSQRNAERNGFRIAYTRIKWSKPSS